jgi:hypothetical protein
VKHVLYGLARATIHFAPRSRVQLAPIRRRGSQRCHIPSSRGAVTENKRGVRPYADAFWPGQRMRARSPRMDTCGAVPSYLAVDQSLVDNLGDHSLAKGMSIPTRLLRERLVTSHESTRIWPGIQNPL